MNSTTRRPPLAARFGIGETVFLKLQARSPRLKGDGGYADPDAVPGMVTAIHFRPGLVTYSVTWADNRHETPHLEIELVGEDDE